MTDTELRSLAEKAHREPWDYWDLASWEYEGLDGKSGMMRPAPLTEPENAALIAAVSPEVVLSLLDRLAAADERLAAIEGEWRGRVRDAERKVAALQRRDLP